MVERARERLFVIWVNSSVHAVVTPRFINQQFSRERLFVIWVNSSVHAVVTPRFINQQFSRERLFVIWVNSSVHAVVTNGTSHGPWSGYGCGLNIWGFATAEAYNQQHWIRWEVPLLGSFTEPERKLDFCALHPLLSFRSTLRVAEKEKEKHR